VRQDVLPEKYWNGTLVRNSALATDLNFNVTNPFCINNFQSLKTLDPLLYSRSRFFATVALVKKETEARQDPVLSIQRRGAVDAARNRCRDPYRGDHFTETFRTFAWRDLPAGPSTSRMAV